MKSKQGRGLSLALGAAVLVVSVLFVSLGILYRTTTDSAESWYIQIDNDLVTEITPHGGMHYRYPVTPHDEGGGRRTGGWGGGFPGWFPGGRSWGGKKIGRPASGR